MADPCGTAKEQHRHRHLLGQDHGVVAGAADHAMHRKTRVLDRLLHRQSQRRIAGDGAPAPVCWSIRIPARAAEQSRGVAERIRSTAAIRCASSAWRTSRLAQRLAGDHVARSRKRFHLGPLSPPTPVSRELPAQRPKSTPPPRPPHRASNSSAWCPRDWPARERIRALASAPQCLPRRRVANLADRAPVPARCEIRDSPSAGPRTSRLRDARRIQAEVPDGLRHGYAARVFPFQ